MPDKIFRVAHADPACSQKLCLADYDAALAEHQSMQFQLSSPGAGQGLAKPGALAEFRSRLWGEASFADRIQVKVYLPRQREMTLRLSDIAVGGEVLYADVQTLMEMGAVEFLVPDHVCRPGQGITSYFVHSIQNRRQFRAFIKELDAAGPMQREAMGNIFWMLCLDESSGSGPVPGADQSLPEPSAISRALESLRVSALESGVSGCPDDDVDYFDEDTGQAVCYAAEEEEPTELGRAFHSAASALGASLGVGAASAVSRGLKFSLFNSGTEALQNSILEDLRSGGDSTAADAIPSE